MGSKRYRVEVLTEGGHSYGAFGNRNAIAYLASMIDDLYCMKVPDKGRTTYNVGQISGGTSINTIAQQAEMLYEYCNIPLSLGIPSVCLGTYEGGKAHTREEWVSADSLYAGYKIAFDLILSYFND